VEFLFVGSKKGPEKLLADNAGIAFVSISAGKFRRYFSWGNLISPFLTIGGFIQSFKILKEFRPNCIFGAGSFVQVPLVWAGWLLKIQVVLHQQDMTPSLANRLCQFAAKKITVVFEASLADFPSSLGFFYKKNANKIELTGNPFREELKNGSKENAEREFGLKADLPTLLVLGGGTGAEFLNQLVWGSMNELVRTVQVIHSTGLGKSKAVTKENYHGYEFIKNMADAYAAADIVLARAGLSTLTELSFLKKLSIIIPLPKTHQELNAWLLARLQAAIVLEQNKTTPEGFVRLIRKLLFEHQAQETLKANIGKIMPKNSNEKIAFIITKLAEI
jgi:UDP-N-acetylglucosamine--N-acetylmuramyl-(pentapeptide) pyrophosphoryl-undecaprenol N-acetylglucosamine transferase